MAETKGDRGMKTYICTAELEIVAESEEDAQIEILGKMSDHDICWDIEEIDE